MKENSVPRSLMSTPDKIGSEDSFENLNLEANDSTNSYSISSLTLGLSTYVFGYLVSLSHPMRARLSGFPVLFVTLIMNKFSCLEDLRDFLMPCVEYFITVFVSIVFTLFPSLHSFFHNVNPPKNTQKVHEDPISRTLFLSLNSMSSIPGSSNKYNFTRSIAENILKTNGKTDPAFLRINYDVLYNHFDYTMFQLETILQSQFYSNRLKSTLGYVIRAFEFEQKDLDRAEKLVGELLWITEKLKECNGLEGALYQWSQASILSFLSLKANSRVQIRFAALTSIMIRQIHSKKFNAEDNTCFKLIKLWLPFLCRTGNLSDDLVFSYGVKQDTLASLLFIVQNFSLSNQEEIYSLWLKEYSSSPSDWPNLEEGYFQWMAKERQNMLSIS